MKNCTFSFCPNFFLESLYMWGSQEKILGHKVNEKIFRVDPGRKKSKKVNKILFPFPFPFPVIPKNGGLWFPFPNFGNGFFHSLPVPQFWECFFPFPSSSRTSGMELLIPVPVLPKVIPTHPWFKPINPRKDLLRFKIHAQAPDLFWFFFGNMSATICNQKKSCRSFATFDKLWVYFGTWILCSPGFWWE